MPMLESAADQRYQHSLPTVSFRIIEDDKALLAPAGVHSEQSRSYGYNDFSDFERPEFYIRYIEPIEAELRHQVEYDMDEQDQAWLDAINAERKKDQSGPISYEVFEIIVDKLEKEWFELIKKIPKPESHLPVEDSRCAICDDPEGENSNAIVFCDGCNLAVHQDCYGVPYIPEGQWLCRKCTVSPENPVSCLFCPSEGGAFKQTTTGHWAHLLCSIWVPEVTVGNAIYMEPIDGVDTVPKSRWKLVCSLCRERVGACIQCDNKNCFVAFHVTCARQMGLLMSMKTMGTDAQLRAFCEKHIPADSLDDAFEQDDEEDSNYSGTPIAPVAKPRPKARASMPKRKTGPVTTKSARAHAKSYRPGPPIVPQIIVKTLLDYVAKFLIRKRQPFVERLCRYWSLKREARRGAPLLKRLHLEPWTASSASKQQTDAEKATKLKFLTMLRNDLEKVRLLAELARKREKDKLRQTQLINDVVDQFIFPYYGKLRLTLERISAMDRQELFLHPINRTDVPDYYEVVKEAMCWLFIDDKIEKNKYLNVEEFKHDINLVLDNAILYNAPETTFTRIAKRIKANCKPLLEELDLIPVWSGFRPPSMDEDEAANAEASGDLEPSLVLLSSLLTTSPNDVTRDHLDALFRFELEKPRAPTPPPAPPKQRKQMSAAERKQKWEERDAMAKDRVVSRSSRAAAAATKAFEQEAGMDNMATPTTRESSKAKGKARSKAIDQAETRSHATHATGATSTSHSNQVGVVGYETYAILSDRERRAQERTMDLVTEDVGNQDLFKRFNVGWVLPEGSKRRRSDRPPEPAKATQSTGEFRKATATTATHDEPPSSRPSSLTPVPSSSSSVTEPLPDPPSKGKGKAVEPAASKNKRKEPDSAESPKTAKKRKGQDDASGKERESTKPPSRSRPRRSTAVPISLPKQETVEEEDPYPPSTLVWAKLTSYPYFPAEIIDQKDNDPSEIPPSIFTNRVQAERDNGAAGKKTWLVRFFDAQASYGWIPANRLDLLGEDNALDEMYLAGKEKTRIKGFKTSHLRTACRKAYREALAQMEIEEEEE